MSKEKKLKKTALSAKEIALKERRMKRNLILLFAGLAFLFYGNSIFNNYSVDDEYVTYTNKTVQQGFKGIPEIFSTFYVSSSGNLGEQSFDYRPMVKLTYAIEYGIFGRNPHWSHFFNVLLFAFTCVFLFLLLRRLLKGYNILFPVGITLLFLAHPIHTEVISSLKNRDEMMSFLGALLGLHFLLNYMEKMKILSLVWGMLFFVLGYLSKSSIIVFAVIYPLVLYFFTDAKPRYMIIFFLVFLVLALTAQFLPRHFLPAGKRDFVYIENPLYVEKDFWLRTGTAMMSLLFYLRILIIPFPLLFYYGYNMIPLTGWGNGWVIVSVLIYAGLLGFAIWKIREKHILSFIILFYLVTVFMYSNLLVPVVGIVGERFVYPASLAFCMGVVWVIFKLMKADVMTIGKPLANRNNILLVLVVIMIPYFFLTFKRNKEWRTLSSLYEADMPYLENSVKANIQYAGNIMNGMYMDRDPEGSVSQDRERALKMISHFRKALQLYPDNYQTLNDLGSAYIALVQNYDSADFYLQKAIRLRPNEETAYINMAFMYKQQKDYPNTLRYYRKVIHLDPKKVKAYSEISKIYYNMGKFDSAFALNKQIMEIDSTSEIPYLNIGNFFLSNKDTITAVAYYEQAVHKQPLYDMCNNLSSYFQKTGDLNKSNYYSAMAERAKKMMQEQGR